MNFETFFAPKIDIRLTEDLNGFVCTVRRGLFRKDSTTFPLDSDRNSSPISVRRNRSYRVVVLRPQQKDLRW
ncbi:MAG: hypothetical protein LAO55_20970 [Acidobacteriia bacterium]|nr:hypothetical protein [Terriglobia bacterium]